MRVCFFSFLRAAYCYISDLICFIFVIFLNLILPVRKSAHLTGLCISEDCLIHCVHAGGNELAEKYRRSALDVTILRDHLGENTRVRPLFRAPKMRSLKAEHRL